VVVEYTLKEAERVWLISDTHFDHANIIRYCHRPFESVDEMNSTLVKNWNETVAPDDVIYFLGDMAFGRGSRRSRWWVGQLRGKIVWVKGSHDHGIRVSSIISNVERVVLSESIACRDVEFMLVHDTFDAVVDGWRGWVIHGHNHDSRPHIDNRFGHKRVNVSAEVIGYKPISLAQIVGEIE